jgi:hypothetical protein
MKTVIQLPTASNLKLLVNASDFVKAGDLIAEYTDDSDIKSIHLAKLLSVAPEKVLSYMKKNVGDAVSAGDIIAQKKSVFSSLTVKSPLQGVIKSVDLKKGSIDLSGGGQTVKKNIVAPVSGKIAAIENGKIDIEMKGHVYKAQQAGGDETVATMIHYTHELVDMFDIRTGVEQCAILCKGVTEDAVYKLDAMGAAASISMSIPKNSSLPWIVIESETYKHLATHAGKKVWIRPKELEIVILE